ncbi:hypothetical protein [Flavobacterium sp.]|uniref:hypothetical protein n=1 Tax=Flavobacterium sp. TaxID=239 RepID=UPI004034D8D8
MHRTYTSYGSIQTKTNKPVTVTYSVPFVQPTGKTNQTQKKGGVTISVEVSPFTVSNQPRISRTIAIADPTKEGYDRYEVKSEPQYKVAPERVVFNIRVRNDEQVPLVLGNIGFMLLVDGVQYSFPEEQIQDWNKGMVISGFEKTYTVPGPQASELKNGQVVHLFLNGVPVSYNRAGNVTLKENFRWYFECRLEEKTATEEVTYRYDFEPVHKEQCKSCSGRGYTSTMTNCGYCAGTGRISNSNGTYACSGCAGTGRREVKRNCANCSASGTVPYPKSQMPPIIGQETLTAWWVTVRSTPVGLPIYAPNVNTRVYEQIGVTPHRAQRFWLSSKGTEYPLIIKYGDQEYKIMPKTIQGNISKSISVDFTTGTPVIRGGVERK